MDQKDKSDNQKSQESHNSQQNTEQNSAQPKKKKHPLAAIRFIRVVPPGAV